MEIILIIIIFLLTGYISYEKLKPKKEKVKLTEEEKRKLETTKKAFESLMNYDYETAMRGGTDE